MKGCYSLRTLYINHVKGKINWRDAKKTLNHFITFQLVHIKFIRFLLCMKIIRTAHTSTTVLTYSRLFLSANISNCEKKKMHKT